MSHQLVMYDKPGCHLCELAYQLVEGLRRDFDFSLERIDITSDPVLLKEYGEKIPVLVIDGEVKLFAPIRLVHVRAALSKRRNMS